MLFRLFLLQFALAAAALLAGETKPIPVVKVPTFLGPYITYQRDPLTTATIHWISDRSRTPAAPALTDEFGNSVRIENTVRTRDFPVGTLVVRYVEFTQLKPGTDYRFTLDEPEAEKSYRFRTLPLTLDEPLRIAIGGDMMHKPEWMEATCRQAAKSDVHCAILGGDLAYENGDRKNAGRVYDWVRVWTRTMRDRKGRLIPFIPVIGNHEVQGSYNGTREKAPFFFSLFTLPEDKSHYAVDFSTYLSVIALDTDHVGKVEDQAAFLKTALPPRAQVPHLFCVYHWPVYGSAKDLPDPAAGKRSKKLLQHWVPLFEAHGVDVCLEHDHHAYKRTPLIRAGKEDPNGILYLGDGAWGVAERKVAQGLWYHDHIVSRRHFILCTLTTAGRSFQAIDSKGKVFDAWPAE